ncbi:PAAR-like protein [Anaeromicropila populeti]|uniref:DUF4280 domain-containing protein n=1 Tax=Anaeromicropila populeti TaxID=37658 RepID=A0A1I6IMM1_9FIRM|nr:PAAR-like protein [Anaeromicropila populeti]SFR67911.1 protein of unknown function [Anaeromicropila populeti]
MADTKSDGDVYLMRGALLQCNCGSHPRRLNLPEDHGEVVITEDEYKHPIVHENDCVIGPTGNIDYFGVCSNLPKNANPIVLTPYVPDGEETPPAGSIVEGGKCIPVFPLNKWSDTKEDVRIQDGSDCKVVTTKSFLKCLNGGIITPLSSGMEYKGEKDG